MLCRCKEFVTRDQEEEEENQEEIGSSTVSVLAVKYVPLCTTHVSKREKNGNVRWQNWFLNQYGVLFWCS